LSFHDDKPVDATKPNVIRAGSTCKISLAISSLKNFSQQLAAYGTVVAIGSGVRQTTRSLRGLTNQELRASFMQVEGAW
jgi:hypothetical protein